MNPPVLVVDIETTGLDGWAYGDKVLEIGISRVDIRRKTVTPFFATPVRAKLTLEQRRHSWIFEQKLMSINEIDESTVSEARAMNIVRCLTRGQYLTSYNTNFDIDRFLGHWTLSYVKAPCIMRASNQIEDIHRKYHGEIGSFPSLMASYTTLCPDDPCHISEQTHRAIDDSMMAGYVLLELVKRGLYDPKRQEEYT